MDKSKCVGCRDDFYNGNNDIGVKECWLLKTAKLQTRYRLSIDCPMDRKSGYVKAEKPSCYHQKGFVFLANIPDYAK